LEVIQLIGQAAGYQGMVGGQMLDFIGRRAKSDHLKELETIHRLKTGALLTASVRAGALVAGGSRAEVTLLTAFGEKFGLVFQITDDLLDVEGEAAEMGKVRGRGRQTRQSHLSRAPGPGQSPGPGPGVSWRRPWPGWPPWGSGPRPSGKSGGICLVRRS
jgi:hypothetical protein